MIQSVMMMQRQQQHAAGFLTQLHNMKHQQQNLNQELMKHSILKQLWEHFHQFSRPPHLLFLHIRKKLLPPLPRQKQYQPHLCPPTCLPPQQKYRLRYHIINRVCVPQYLSVINRILQELVLIVVVMNLLPILIHQLALSLVQIPLLPL